MYIRGLIPLLLLLLTACAASPLEDRTLLSGIISPDPAPVEAEGPLIGVIADSQLQTRGNYHSVFGYRGPFADRMVWVSMRPPAVDWSARAMLLARLEELRAEGAKAIFYLGDGANNGCEDEFSAGFGVPGKAPPSNDDGLLTILDKFRTVSGIPIYFVLGNHDLLGAGSTGNIKARERFCDDLRPGRFNRWLSKFEVIALADRFNRGNASSAEWSYASSFDWKTTKRFCGPRLAQQHRLGGCYLAATVDYRGPGASTQFLLLDTNDWANVSRSLLGWLQQEGIRGAMSFGKLNNGAQSQTSWFEQSTKEPVRLRVAMTHYNVESLQKKDPLLGRISRKSQRFMNLFTDPDTRASKQDGAYVISAHTHTPRIEVHKRPFRIGCTAGDRGCSPLRLEIAELNIGSTSDYSNYAAMVKLVPPGGVKGALHYKRLGAEPAECLDIWKEVAGHSFPRSVPEAPPAKTGWAALGTGRLNRLAYQYFNWDDADAVWDRLDVHLKGRELGKEAECIGLYAAAMEYGIDPATGAAFAPKPPKSHQPTGGDRYPAPRQ
jgi:hypothetical protein